MSILRPQLSALYLWENETTIFHQKNSAVFSSYKRAHTALTLLALTRALNKNWSTSKHYPLCTRSLSHTHTRNLSLTHALSLTNVSMFFFPFKYLSALNLILHFFPQQIEKREREARTSRTNEEREKRMLGFATHEHQHCCHDSRQTNITFWMTVNSFLWLSARSISLSLVFGHIFWLDDKEKSWAFGTVANPFQS